MGIFKSKKYTLTEAAKDSDKNCKCTHCGSSFEIERDSSKPDSIEQFDLKPIGKVFSIFYALSFIESFAILLFMKGFII